MNFLKSCVQNPVGPAAPCNKPQTSQTTHLAPSFAHEQKKSDCTEESRFDGATSAFGSHSYGNFPASNDEDFLPCYAEDYESLEMGNISGGGSGGSDSGSNGDFGDGFPPLSAHMPQSFSVRDTNPLEPSAGDQTDCSTDATSVDGRDCDSDDDRDRQSKAESKRPEQRLKAQQQPQTQGNEPLQLSEELHQSPSLPQEADDKHVYQTPRDSRRRTHQLNRQSEVTLSPAGVPHGRLPFSGKVSVPPQRHSSSSASREGQVRAPAAMDSSRPGVGSAKTTYRALAGPGAPAPAAPAAAPTPAPGGAAAGAAGAAVAAVAAGAAGTVTPRLGAALLTPSAGTNHNSSSRPAIQKPFGVQPQIKKSRQDVSQKRMIVG